MPLDRIVAQLNIDMIGRNRDDKPSEANTVYLVGSDRISSELHEINREANSALPQPLTLDYEMNDPADPEQLYYRSDHYSYAAKGIPIIFFTTGLHPDYHANTDEVSKIEFDEADADRRSSSTKPAAASPISITRRSRDNKGRGPGREHARDVTRPLLVIFLTIFVNLVGFGIIVPLLPFYAETFGASPLAIGLLFAVFSLVPARRGAGARRSLGPLRPPSSPDLQPRGHGRELRRCWRWRRALTMLFLARIVDGLSGGNISTARAYVADVTEPKDRARAYGLIGAAFGLGFILGPALSGALAQVSYTAPIWAAAGITLVATVMALVLAARNGAPGAAAAPACRFATSTR